MKSIHNDLNKIIEKIIDLRINNIIDKGNIDKKIGEQIINVNKNITKDVKIKDKKVKKNTPKDEKILTLYTAFIKDSKNIANNKNNLNYLPNSIIDKIKSYENESAREQFKDFSIIWKGLDDNIKNKYKDLCKDKHFTNADYDNIVNKLQSPKTIKKKKSKESLKVDV
jgi:phage-related tail protein